MGNQYTCNIYSTIEINQIVSLYLGGTSFSEIGLLLKRKKKKIKDILINEGVWVEGRDIKRKYFTENEVKEIINQYVNDGCGLREISRNFNVSISPIKRILIENNVLRKGYSNGKKIDLSDDQKDEIKRLYLVENKNSVEIGKILGYSKSLVEKHISREGYLRSKSEAASIGLVKRFLGIHYDEYLKTLPKFKKYKSKVLSITNKQPIEKLENFKKRGASGIHGAYHLDHKYSISMGFLNDIKPEIIGNILNLEFIPWEENIKKRTNCSITKNELKSITQWRLAFSE